MPSNNTSDVTHASDSTYFVDIARVTKINHLLTYVSKVIRGSESKQESIVPWHETYIKICSQELATSELKKWQTMVNTSTPLEEILEARETRDITNMLSRKVN